MNKWILAGCLLICMATVGVVIYVERSERKKTAVVDAIKLFDQFNMKKELEETAKVKLQAISKQVDSVTNLLQMAKATRNEDEIKKLQYVLEYMNSVMENAYKESNTDINAQVWKRLNPIIDQYGKANGLHLIIGANGMGSVLYQDDYYDLTADLIKFANKTYEQGN